MRYLIQTACLFILLCQSAAASQKPISFDAEIYSKTFVTNPPSGNKLIEFLRENETFENWTKLIGYRSQQAPAINNNPEKMVENMASVLKASNPEATYKIIVNEQGTEAMIDFLTWPADGKFIEFNIFRYIKSKDGKAVVSLQLAHRFTGNPADILDKIKKLRASWIDLAVAYDMKAVESALDNSVESIN